MFGQLAAAAFDEFGQLGAAGVHRLALAAQALVAVLLSGDAQTHLVERLGEGVFLRAGGFGGLGSGRALGLMAFEEGSRFGEAFFGPGDACRARPDCGVRRRPVRGRGCPPGR